MRRFKLLTTITAAAALTVGAGTTFAATAAPQQAVPPTGPDAPPTASSVANRPEEIPINFPHTIVAEVFNGPIVQILDGATFVVERDSRSDRSRRMVVRLYGLKRAPAGAAASPDGSEPARRYLNDNLKGKIVRVEGRRRSADGALEAVVTQAQSAPRKSILVPIRNPDIQPDLPHGPDAPPPGAIQPSGFQSDPSLNVLLVRLGLARRDDSIAKSDPDMAKRLADAEDSARKDKNGLWANAVPISSGAASSAEMPGGK